AFRASNAAPISGSSPSLRSASSSSPQASATANKKPGPRADRVHGADGCGRLSIRKIPSLSGAGRLEDAVDRRSEDRIEFLVALLCRQALGQRTREGGDHAVVFHQLGVRLVAGVAARQR